MPPRLLQAVSDSEMASYATCRVVKPQILLVVLLQVKPWCIHASQLADSCESP